MTDKKPAKNKGKQLPGQSSPAEISAVQMPGLQAIAQQMLDKQTLKFKTNETTNAITPAMDNKTYAVLMACEATGTTDLDAALALINQLGNAMPGSEVLTKANAGLALVSGMAPKDEIEGLLCTQLVVAHSLAMEYAKRANRDNITTNHADSLVNRITKLMTVSNKHVETLQKYRAKGTQQIIVQHQQVNVGHGGQAIVGNVTQGEAGA